jgi:hypothetical protein
VDSARLNEVQVSHQGPMAIINAAERDGWVLVLACFDHELSMKRPNKPSNSAANERNKRRYGGLVKWSSISSAYLSTPLSRFKRWPPLAVQIRRH